MKKITGTKMNMSQIFQEDGRVIPVTLIRSEETVGKDLEGTEVIIRGLSKGKGFAGGMKRWGFHGGDATRGQSDKPRAPGSIGSQTPGRVRKGKKMAGHLGSTNVTVKGLRIVKVSPKDSIFMVSGSVPGARNTKLTITLMQEEEKDGGNK